MVVACPLERCCLSPTSIPVPWRAGGGSKRRTHRDLANGTAALFVSVLGFGTIALMLRPAWPLHWLNHGHQLTAIAAYRYEANASSGAAVYLFMLIWFPVIGLVMSALGAACTPLGRPAPGELPPVPAMPR